MCFCLLAGCGGGSDLTGIDGSGDGGNGNPDTQNDGGSETPAPQTPNPIVDDPETQPQLAKPISAIGPITSNQNGLTINGITFDISDSQITVDGVIGSSEDLRVGQVVNVNGTYDPQLNTGDATTVNYDTNVLGPIDSLDLLNHKVVIMGQAVFFDDNTIFSGAVSSFSGLRLGHVIRVSGQVNSNGGINATFMEFIAESIDVPGVTDLLEVTGRIKNLNQPNVEFQINDLLIDYSGATLQAEPNDGILVQVLGNSFDDRGRFVANVVEVVDVTLGAFGSTIQLEGLVTSINSQGELSVSGIPVVIDQNTLIQGGQSEDLALNVEVIVEGKIDENDKINADKIIILNVGDVMLFGMSDPDLQRIGDMLIFSGGLAIITTSEATYFKDESDIARDPLFLSDLQPNDFLEIWGKRVDNGTGALQLQATRITRRNSKTQFGDTVWSRFVGVIDDVRIINNQFLTFTALNAEWSPWNRGRTVQYYDEQNNLITIDDPKVLIGRRVRATLYWTELGFIRESGVVARIELLP